MGGLLTENTTIPKSINYKAYLRSPAWKDKAKAAKIRAGNRCQGCNRPGTEVQLEAHHRTYERLGHESLGDITVFCRDCHQSIEESKAKISLVQKLEPPECGVCIRCQQDIAFNHHRPLCPGCYKIWRKKSNSYSATTNYCHMCGKPNQTSMAKPMCLDCYKEFKILKVP